MFMTMIIGLTSQVLQPRYHFSVIFARRGKRYQRMTAKMGKRHQFFAEYKGS